MFGAPLREHGQRYEHLAEWLQVVKMLWQSPDEFDHHGEFFDIIGGISLPKPLQEGGPPIMNAGTSERGKRFACEHANVDRKSVVWGKSVSVRVDLGGRSGIKKKNE